MRDLLERQLDIAWGFAVQCVIDRVPRESVLWEPSTNVVTVHESEGGWVADWPDEKSSPQPDATVGWLLWHVEWWWTDAARVCRGQTGMQAAEHRWSGSTDGLVAAKREWDEILHTHDLEAEIVGLMPTPQPFWFVAAWVNFELIKNLAEINQLLTQRANR